MKKIVIRLLSLLYLHVMLHPMISTQMHIGSKVALASSTVATIFAGVRHCARANNNFSSVLNIFPLGDRKFCHDIIPNGLTREQWYRQQMSLQEKKCIDTILGELEFSADEIIRTQQLVKEIQYKQNQFVERRFIRNYKIEEEYLENNNLKNIKIYNALVDLDVAGSSAVMATFSNTIIKYPIFDKICSSLQKLAVEHECSHINHQDNLITNLLMTLLFLRKQKMGLVSNVINTSFDLNHDCSLIVENKEINDENIKKAEQLFKKLINESIERRADMEAFFAYVKSEHFKQILRDYGISELKTYQGFPLAFPDLQFSAYLKAAKVNYLLDFIEGNARDFKSL